MITVIVEVPPESPQELAQAAIDGCDGALGRGRCRLARSSPALPSRYYARIGVRNREPRLVSVELREKGRSGRLLEMRELEFSERDTPVERSSSVGVVIAALVAAHEKDEPLPRAERVPEPRTAPASSEPKGLVRLRADVGGTLSLALENDPVVFGGLLRLSALFEPWPVFAMASTGYETGSRDQPSVSRWLGGLGAGVRLGASDSPLAAELRTEAATERVGIRAVDPSSGRSETAARWRFGARIGLDGVWTFSPQGFGLVLGGQASVLRPAVIVDLHDHTVERAPAFGWGTFVGLRYAP